MPITAVTNRNTKFAKILRKLSTAADWSGCNGVLYALKICTINGRIAKIRVTWKMKINASTMANGLSDCWRFNWASFSIIVAGGCLHINCLLMHGTHDFVRSLYCWSEWNSSIAAPSETQPRNHRRAFNASCDRSALSNQIGDSGT